MFHLQPQFYKPHLVGQVFFKVLIRWSAGKIMVRAKAIMEVDLQERARWPLHPAPQVFCIIKGLSVEPGVQSYLERAGVGAEFHSNQEEATSESTEDSAQALVIELVKSGVAPDRLEWKPVYVPVLSGYDCTLLL